MSRNSFLVRAFIGLLCVSAARAQEPAAAPFEGANPAAFRQVTCVGTSSVPMTADADQALPLHLVANLKCGEKVLALSASDGYTVQVRTADGRSGFIAAMSLKKVPPPPRTLSASTLKNGVARWDDRIPNCTSFMSTDHSIVESTSVEGITVQVSLYDTGWKYRALIAIANDSPQPVEIDPSKFMLDEIGAEGKPLFYNNPAELAKNTTHQVLWSQANAAPFTMPARPGFRSSSDSHALMLAYRTPTERPNSATNYLLSHENAESDFIDTQTRQTLVDYPKQVLALALKPGVVAPTEMVSGAVWFDRGKKAGQLVLRIPLEGISFEFPLTFQAPR
jgi:hypothetical protein